jgi:hypothetical protein
MFDVDDPEEEEAIDVPVFSKDAPDSTTAASTTSESVNHSFRRVYTSNAAGSLNARLTGQRVTKNTASGKSAGYLNSFFGESSAASQQQQRSSQDKR